MTDPRRTPANARVMADSLPADSSGRQRVEPEPAQIGISLVDLLRQPDGPRDRQLLLGDAVDVIERSGDMAFVQAQKDGYVGYVPISALSPAMTATHRVSSPATHAYADPDLKSPVRAALNFGALLSVTGMARGYAETQVGFVPETHLRALSDPFTDPVGVAAIFLGTPYLWGGNARDGIDCSGLVQIACLACDIPCPGDSDQQEGELGHTLPPGTAPERGDLLFWKGHVAWVASPTHILHANAHSMATNYENLADAINRIEASGDGPVTAHKRL